MNGLVKHFPNVLTALRIAAAPALAFLLVSGADRAALGVFAFAGLSDAADGFLAKRFGLTTRFGRLLDPVADKLLMLVSFATLTILGVAPLWLTLLVLARDAAILAGLLLARVLNVPVRVAPLLIGKASTAMQTSRPAVNTRRSRCGERRLTVRRRRRCRCRVAIIRSRVACGAGAGTTSGDLWTGW